MPPPFATTYQQVTIQRGMVVDVDPINYTVDVRTSGTYEYHEACPYASPYCHPIGGEGIDFMPEQGSIVYLCHGSEPERLPFVIGWIMPEDSNGSSRGNRKRLNRGDIRLGTRDGCEMWMHRGGVLEIGSGQMPRRMYIPTLNTIRDYCLNYELYFVGGEDKYLVKRGETSQDAQAEVIHEKSLRRHTSDKLASVEIREGKVSDTVVLETSVFDVLAADRRELKIRLQMHKDGRVDWDVQDSWSLIVGKHALVEAAEDLYLISGAGPSSTYNSKMEIRADSGNMEIMAKTGSVTVKAPKGTLTLASKKVNITLAHGTGRFTGRSFIFGAGAKAVVLDPDHLANIFNNHTHIVSVPTTLGPPGLPVPVGSAVPSSTLSRNTLRSKIIHGE
jgi:hypothetical protein